MQSTTLVRGTSTVPRLATVTYQHCSVIDEPAIDPAMAVYRCAVAPLTAASLVKSALVFTLIWLFAWKPSVAMILGRLVLRLWPGFRGA